MIECHSVSDVITYGGLRVANDEHCEGRLAFVLFVSRGGHAFLQFILHILIHDGVGPH